MSRCKGRLGECAHPGRNRGLSLMELLVALVLVALVGTLLVQGVAFFGGSYDAVKRNQRDASHAALRQHWFVSVVRGIVPYGVEARAFRGDPEAFEGITLQPLNEEPGMPTTIRWTIAADGLMPVVTYAEDGPPWAILESEAVDLAFQYADARGRWYDRWPREDQPTHWTPTMIRLVADAGTVWLARVEASPEPIIVDVLLR